MAVLLVRWGVSTEPRLQPSVGNKSRYQIGPPYRPLVQALQEMLLKPSQLNSITNRPRASFSLSKTGITSTAV